MLDKITVPAIFPLVFRNCHGSKIKEPIQENITKLYNNDKAVDYKMGEIRGAFSLSKKIN